MHGDQVQKALYRVQLGQAQILDFLGDLRLIDIIYPLAPSKATEKVGLVLRPGQDITLVKTVRHPPPVNRFACPVSKRENAAPAGR